jgi:flagellar motor switch protein FliN
MEVMITMSNMTEDKNNMKQRKGPTHAEVDNERDDQSYPISHEGVRFGAHPDSKARGKVSQSQNACSIDFLLDIPLEITIELDRTTMLIHELLKLGQGSVIELSKFAGETLDVLANQRLIAKGEVVVINDKYGIRLTEIISPMERIVRLK